MKSIIRNIQTTTADFNLFGKVLAYVALAVIITAALSLAIGVILNGSPNF